MKKTFFDVKPGKDGKVVIVGIPWDKNTTCREGAAKLPELARQASEYLEEYSFFQRLDIREESITDYGNINIDPKVSFETVMSTIDGFFNELLGKRLLIVGGDHSITYLAVRNLAKFIRRYVVLDAHADMYPAYNNNKYSHASVLRRIVEILDPSRILVLGVRTLSRIEENQLEEFGIDYYISSEIKDNPEVLEEELSKADYISIDLDVFDPGFVPDVSCPEPFGLDPAILLSVFRSARLRARAVDIVEGVPINPFSPSAIITATLVREFSLILEML